MRVPYSYLSVFLFAALFFLFISCKKSDDTPTTPLAILSLSSTHAAGGNEISLSGTGFNTSGDKQVTVNGATAQITESLPTGLYFIVPLKAGTGPVSVTVNGQTVKGPILTYDTTWTIAPFAGGTQGDVDGTGTAAELNDPGGLCSDSSGNIYFTESATHRIKKITPSGVVTTIAGNGSQGSADGQGKTATFDYPFATCIDPSGTLYVASVGDNTIRKMSPTGLVTTIASSATNFLPGRLWGICTDGSGNIFVTDEQNCVIYRITSNGAASIFAGSYSVSIDKDGTGTNASFDNPTGICIDGQNNLYVQDENNIRRITPAGIVTTVAPFVGPYLYIDTLNRLYGADAATVSQFSGSLANTLVGPGSNGINGTINPLKFASGLTLDRSGNLYISDNVENVIYKMAWQ